jgi:uncharacterized membrane protein YphA (DoxX/SURF4 family)
MRPFYILAMRIGFAVMFLVQGVFMLKYPSQFNSESYRYLILALPMMAGYIINTVAVINIVLGVFLLINVFTRLVTLLGIILTAIVLLSLGFWDIRFTHYVGVLAGLIGLFGYYWPQSIKELFYK